MATLSIDKITKAFGHTTVIPELSLTIEDGEFCVLVGPSGCGKSTLLRIIAGLEPISSGRILVDGVDMSGAEPPERGVAMVFQSYALYPHMDVDRNIGFGLKIARTPAAEIVERVGRAAEKLRLGSYLKRKPRELSGGQRQRVAIGRAMTRKPKLFLLDEPLSNLDAALRVGMRVEIARLKVELASTMVYVTHDQVEAMTLADRIVVMNSGRIEQVGTPLDLYHRPANLFVAGFIGSPAMNFLNGKVVASRGMVTTVALSMGPTLDIAVERHIEPGDSVTLGIRPEHIALAGEGQANAHVVQASMVELLGSDTFIHANEGEESLVIRDSHGRIARAGDRVAISLPARVCHLFNSNGDRISDATAAHAEPVPLSPEERVD
ncbi:sn-glycerol-3-phosphate ABC transporter ATP-binding protein UgpC [Mesorhizobium waimense]|uniref:sn-glycerol-3-phosphate ABC transporter ATP-binding protein UgpC n=1 Tax=Mesorhizobium waimense TaxID=1300307 RepID=A0A3A5KX14_9HYPH|nr:sn-glycerol-3-phosphate ABC transporter ATP-binding protein UgpC [Mesorhizobium waimense]RJT41302.1 sn-glycerol-3-phosphate ABC transporter ATP-binding protein UgpC [Mesorhizobium waimense]